METLNLIANGTVQERIKEYLEANASDVLAEKINNGTSIERDGKTLINKKTLDGFMNYATDEARKIAEQGARSACIEDSVVFGWAIHYFEEESIEGTLYNEDGTEYKKPVEKKAKTKKATSEIEEDADTSKPDTKEKKAQTIPQKEPQKSNSNSTQSQMSLFDLLGV